MLALPLGCTGVGLGVGTRVAVDSGLLSAAGFDGLLLEPVDGFSTLDGLEEVLELGDGGLVSGTASFASIFVRENYLLRN